MSAEKSDHSRRHASDEELLSGAIPIDESDLDESDDAGGQAGQAQAQGESAAAAEDESELQPIELEPDEEETDEQARARRNRIQAIGERTSQHVEHQWNRQPNVTGQGAVRVKTFVAKLRPDAIEHLDEQVNEWLDKHPEYEVKFVTTAIGPMVGKITEDALFMNVWV